MGLVKPGVDVLVKLCDRGPPAVLKPGDIDIPVKIVILEEIKFGPVTVQRGCAAMGTDCRTTSLNSDGTELYLFKNDNFDGNIYVTRFENGRWTPVTKLNKNINTRFYESHASVSPDGKKLYFTSNREQSLGELDLWVSEKDATGEWGVPANLGNTVNTPYNEETPFISKDGKTLTFSSEGHNSMGGYDIFVTHLG